MNIENFYLILFEDKITQYFNLSIYSKIFNKFINLKKSRISYNKYYLTIRFIKR